MHTTLLAQYPEPFQRWCLANIWLGKPSRPGRWGRPSSKNKGNLDVHGGQLHRPFWTCFSLKNTSDLDLKYRDNRRVCGWRKNRCVSSILDLRKRACLYVHEKRCVSSILDLQKRTFSTFENGRVCMFIKRCVSSILDLRKRTCFPFTGAPV